MNIALNLYSLRQTLKNEESIEHTLKEVKQIGFDHVVLSGIGPFTEDKINHIANITKSLNMKIIGTHIDFNQLEDGFDDMVSFHKALGANYIGIGALPEGYDRSSLNDYQRFIFKANQLATKLKPHGLKLVYHHHAFEFVKIDEFLPIDIMIQNLMSDNLYIEADAYWLQFAGLNPIDFIETNHHKMISVQIKDMQMKLSSKWVSTALSAPIGEGNMNYKKILPQIRSVGIDTIIIEQDDFYGQDPFVEIKKSFDNVKRI